MMSRVFSRVVHERRTQAEAMLHNAAYTGCKMPRITAKDNELSGTIEAQFRLRGAKNACNVC